MNSIFLILIERLGKAIATVPDLGNKNVIILVSYGLFTLALGWASGFLCWDLCSSTKIVARVIATSLIAPAILEELFFRVLLLPYPSDSTSQKYLIWSAFSLFLFVIYHPLNGLTFFARGRKVFLDPIFLLLATALGITCTISYWQTGSLWLPVLVHWVAVVLWLLCFGGFKNLELR